MSFSSNKNKKLAAIASAISLILTLSLMPAPRIGAADHGDAPANANDRAGDIGDAYLFLDPTDNTRLVVAMTMQGFIIPAEAVNFGFFDHNLRYRLELETNNDATPDHFIDVTFSEKMTSPSNPQTATVTSTLFPTFTGPTTVANLSATAAAPTITNDPGTGIALFAGEVDDPFFFDIPAFSRFVASVNANMPDPTQFQRGRDSFAGYNTLGIMLSIPLASIRPLLSTGNNVVGLNSRTQRRSSSVARRPTRFPSNPTFTNVDRAGVPAVNVALIPYARKNEFNLVSTEDDAGGRFAADIVATLTRFGTNQTNIGILAGVAVAKGDFLRVDITRANSGPGGGNNSGAGFPNGRRLGDDVIDTILFFVANQNALSDNANANDVPLRDAFPFFAAPQQPRATGVTDDNTRN
ncbi:MAG: DUF4331 family protein [Blastocatellia bacterium]